MIRLFFVLILLLTGLVAASLAFGDVSLGWQELYDVLMGTGRAQLQSEMIVWDLRLPRVLLALLVGIALALAGTISIAIMRNPLADPGVLGINSGAAAAAMAVIVLINDPPVALLQVAGFLGASAMALAVFALAWRSGTSSLRIILIGIGLSALASAGTTFLSAFGDIGDVQRALVWLAGSVYDANMVKVRLLALWLIVPIALTLLAARELDLIRFGDNSARSLGQPVDRIRGLMILLVTVLSGAAIAVSGLIGFVGLVAPHIGRRLAGVSHARMLPVAALVGACLVVAADLIGRVILPPVQIPAGIVTGLVGAPFFGYILWRRRHDH
ncbi:FecCD family ABC transporter permease [Agrobacterium vitis]|uniref:FecCD family ABC transporter permease n=1 Tax=Agrobacterium vitis TaxID=373 RepID=UPI0015DA4FBA|nr:iron ABC transporter permease [Agrobacterium vitis]MCF1455639.1 iron ABC transporter permease [Agrobacterium vitis]BCH56691.1 iron ABC transporter permease [Agrobacterium vitis]